MEQYYLAVDFGASGGRHIAAKREGDRLVFQEVYRFPNGPVQKGGRLCWDLEYLEEQLIEGMRRCGERGIVPAAMGIDTWGLDYVLLDREGRRLGPAVSHRDPRTKGIYEEIFADCPREELYQRTGIQMAEFNTLCQLAAQKRDQPELLERAALFLMIPDYLNYRLTGVAAQEYTNAATTQLLRAGGRQWDEELLDRLGIPRGMFLLPSLPGRVLGTLRPEVAKRAGFCCRVILPPTHDTAAAFLALPPEGAGEPAISSGTWSLMGMETEFLYRSREALDGNFTNEGGYGGVNLLLKNSMGLWMIQQIRAELGGKRSYGELCAMAERERIASLADCQSAEFMAPESMSRAVQDFCRRTGQEVPQTAGELLRVVYRSLAASYAATLSGLEALCGRSFKRLTIIGGGSRAEYLNRLTAQAAGIPVVTGPDEATAAGNLAAQMLADGVFTDVREARQCVAASFTARRFEPDKEE